MKTNTKRLKPISCGVFFFSNAKYTANIVSQGKCRFDEKVTGLFFADSYAQTHKDIHLCHGMANLLNT
jgi:hypothetical protein